MVVMIMTDLVIVMMHVVPVRSQVAIVAVHLMSIIAGAGEVAFIAVTLHVMPITVNPVLVMPDIAVVRAPV